MADTPVSPEQKRSYLQPRFLSTLQTQYAGSRNSSRNASIAASTSGVSVVPNASMFSSSCASEVTPMMVLATCHLV